MTKYMLILGGADVDKRVSNLQLAPLLFERYLEWMEGLRASGKYLAAHKLHDQTGRRLTIRGGEVMDGPFIEAKEAVGGIFMIEAASLDEATTMARSCPVLDLQHGYVEIREVDESRAIAK